MNVKISVLMRLYICYYSLHDYTFNLGMKFCKDENKIKLLQEVSDKDLFLSLTTTDHIPLLWLIHSPFLCFL